MKDQIVFIRDILKKQYFKLLLLLLATVAFVSMNLIQPIIFGIFIDNVVALKPIDNVVIYNFTQLLGGVEYLRSNLWVGALIMLLVTFIAGLMVFSRSRLNGLISENVSYNIREKLFKHLMNEPYAYFVRSKTGDLIQRATSDIDIVRRVFAGQVSEFIYAISIVSIALIIMFNINSQLAFVSSMLLPIIFIFAIVFFIFVKKNFKAFEHADSNLTHAISENLAATRVVKAFNREAYEKSQFDVVNSELKKTGIKMIDALALYWGISDFMCFTSILLTLVYGVIMVSNNNLSIGQLVVFTSYSGMMVWPLRQMGRIIADLGKVSVSINRLVEVVQSPIEDTTSGLLTPITGNIELNDVTFAYDDDPSLILKGVTLNIKAGETVAIVGPTGSGKSSLIHILTALYDYSSGSIKIDGVELRDIQKHHLRQNLSVVLQEPFLFSKTVKDNILISMQQASEDDLRSAAHISHVESFINNFELGYDTVIGERGTTLSGGQKQRVAIARSIINDSPVIIFDDSLSAVDTQTDKDIRAKLDQIKQKATTIIITQRISSSKDADKIFVLEAGKITQSGTHEQLVNTPGLYKRINDVQSKIEVGDKDGK